VSLCGACPKVTFNYCVEQCRKRKIGSLLGQRLALRSRGARWRDSSGRNITYMKVEADLSNGGSFKEWPEL
jgi:hypothetical protein